jgi:hypothetical protein
MAFGRGKDGDDVEDEAPGLYDFSVHLTVTEGKMRKTINAKASEGWRVVSMAPWLDSGLAIVWIRAGT